MLSEGGEEDNKKIKFPRRNTISIDELHHSTPTSSEEERKTAPVKKVPKKQPNIPYAGLAATDEGSYSKI